jgi:hypothetical protein
MTTLATFLNALVGDRRRKAEVRSEASTLFNDLFDWEALSRGFDEQKYTAVDRYLTGRKDQNSQDAVRTLQRLRSAPAGSSTSSSPSENSSPGITSPATSDEAETTPDLSVSGRGSQGGTISDAELTRDEMTVATSVSGAATPVGTMEMSFDFEPLDHGSRESSEPRDDISLFEYQRKYLESQ